MRRLLAICLLGSLILGCGGVDFAPTPLLPTPPAGRWWASPGVSMCGPIAKLWAHETVMLVGGCDGNLRSDHGLIVDVRVNEQFSIHLFRDTSVAPQQDPAVAELVGATDEGTTFVYQAIAPGTTPFMYDTHFCVGPVGMVPGPCPLLQLIVSD